MAERLTVRIRVGEGQGRLTGFRHHEHARTGDAGSLRRCGTGGVRSHRHRRRQPLLPPRPLGTIGVPPGLRAQHDLPLERPGTLLHAGGGADRPATLPGTTPRPSLGRSTSGAGSRSGRASRSGSSTRPTNSLRRGCSRGSGHGGLHEGHRRCTYVPTVRQPISRQVATTAVAG